MAKQPKTDRIHQLEDELKVAERRISEMRAERDEARELVERMEEHVKDADSMIERWIEAFDMHLDDSGLWVWTLKLTEQFDALKTKYHNLLNSWNRFVPRYNAVVQPREIGRPLNASDAQCAQVRKLRKAGSSFRDISDETNLGLQTVRTILGRAARSDRTSIARLQRIDPDHAAVNAWKARKRSRETLPKRINETMAGGAALLKEAKGLGR